MTRVEKRDKGKGTQYHPEESTSFPEIECCFPEITVGRNTSNFKGLLCSFSLYRTQGVTVVNVRALPQ